MHAQKNFLHSIFEGSSASIIAVLSNFLLLPYNVLAPAHVTLTFTHVSALCEHGLRGMVGLGSITPPKPVDVLIWLLSMLHGDSLLAIFDSEHPEIYGAAV